MATPMTDPDVVLAYRLLLAILTDDVDAYAITMAEVSSLDRAHSVITALSRQWAGSLAVGRLATNIAETVVPLANKRKVRRARIPMGAALTSRVIHDVEDEIAFQLDGPKDES
jgi:hypothetical protein